MSWSTLLIGALGVALPSLVPPAAQATLGSQTFAASGEHTFVVPPAVDGLLVSVVGGNGGAGDDGAAGGVGATVTAAVSVHPGEKLYAEVGGNGNPGVNTPTGGLGGYDGGGPGGSQVFLFAGVPSGGGGGGASDIRTVPACAPSNPACGSLASRLIVAGGGGGGGGNTSTSAGGNGGAADADGFSGQTDTQADSPGSGGRRGTLKAGGAPGTPGDTPPGAPGVSSPGVFAQGGNGALALGGAGGGGGGGIFGGGGGGAGAGQLVGNNEIVAAGGGGGGGGSSSQSPGPKGVTNLTLRPTASGAQPVVELFWKLPRPTVLTLRPAALRATSATLRGTINPNAAPVASCHFTISPATPAGGSIPCAQQIHKGTVSMPVSARVAALKPRTEYTVRLVAADAQGTARAKPVTFTTPRRRAR